MTFISTGPASRTNCASPRDPPHAPLYPRNDDCGSVVVYYRYAFVSIVVGCIGPLDHVPLRAVWTRTRLHVTVRKHVEHAMPANAQRRPAAEKVRAHRARLRAQGLRPIQIWVPDVRSATFVAEAHQQSMAVASSAQAEEDQAFVDAVSDRRE